MALQMTVTCPDGNTATYIKIQKLTIDKLNVTIVLDAYKDQASRLAGNAPSICGYKAKLFPALPKYSFIASSFTADYLAEAYIYLKTLPDFSTATDA